MSPDLSIWERLALPFPDTEVKQRPGAAKWDHKDACQKAQCRETRDPDKHIQFSYVDARAVAQRLDDILTPGGWQFTCAVIPGTDVVKGRLEVFAPSVEGGTVREDHGYPNSERDEEPIKAATSDALKRCAVLFGVGRHLYEDNRPTARPARPTNGHSAAPVRQAAPVPVRSSTAVPEPPLDWDQTATASVAVLDVDGSMTYGELADRANLAGVPIKALGDASKKLFGQQFWKLTDLTDVQRFAVAIEVGLA